MLDSIYFIYLNSNEYSQELHYYQFTIQVDMSQTKQRI